MSKAQTPTETDDSTDDELWMIARSDVAVEGDVPSEVVTLAMDIAQRLVKTFSTTTDVTDVTAKEHPVSDDAYNIVLTANTTSTAAAERANDFDHLDIEKGVFHNSGSTTFRVVDTSE